MDSEPDRSENAVTHSVADPDQQARAWIAIARHVPRSEARRLVAAVLQARRWLAALPVLAAIQPEVAIAIGQDFRNLSATTGPDVTAG